MNAVLPLGTSRPVSLKDRIAQADVLIFDVDGTLAETEGIHRRAFNAAFLEHDIDWYWDHGTYRNLLRVAGGKERLCAYAKTQSPPSRYSVSQLAEVHQGKTRHYARLMAEHTCRLRPGVEALIHAAIARRQTLAIATTTTFSNVEKLLSVGAGSGETCLRPLSPATRSHARSRHPMSISRCWHDLSAPPAIALLSRTPPTA